jgi:hypothetical protein
MPPPLVKRIKGIRLDWRKLSDSDAPGIGAELRTRTPSILDTDQRRLELPASWKAYSKANAKSGISILAPLLSRRPAGGRDRGRQHCFRWLIFRGPSLWRSALIVDTSKSLQPCELVLACDFQVVCLLRLEQKWSNKKLNATESYPTLPPFNYPQNHPILIVWRTSQDSHLRVKASLLAILPS